MSGSRRRDEITASIAGYLRTRPDGQANLAEIYRAVDEALGATPETSIRNALQSGRPHVFEHVTRKLAFAVVDRFMSSQ